MPVSSDQPSHAWKGYALAVLAAASWATGGLTAKWLFSPLDATTSAWPLPPLGMQIDPAVLSGARALTAFALLAAYLVFHRPGEIRVSIREVPFLAVFGVFGLAAVHFTYFKAISYTNVATAILLEYLAPVIVLVFSVAFLGERLTWSLPAGVALSITGCALVVGAASPGGIVVSVRGVAWGLAAAAFFALYSLLGKHAAGRFSPWRLLVFGLGFATLFWVIYLRGVTAIFGAMSSPGGAASIVYVAVVSTIVPFSAFLKALHYIDATRATVTATLEPVIAGIAAWLLLGETFDGTQLAGGAFVMCAILLVQRTGHARESLPPAT
ncbi:MAG: DMT family transporter [Actinomycetota bacterium]|nr:DMT family transporter [Actinomycetota bacterium]